MKGSRVQNVEQELQGERIDIVTWSPDPAKYVYNALAPAHVSMVRADEDAKSLLVVVPNDQLSLAIGRQGQNVRLASRLLGWRIDVKSEQRYANLENSGYQSILALNGVDEALADQLFSKGISSTLVLADKNVDDLTIIRAINEEFAQALIDEAKANPFEEQTSNDSGETESIDGETETSEVETEVPEAEKEAPAVENEDGSAADSVNDIETGSADVQADVGQDSVESGGEK
jgi:N utilization substance protein A